MKMLLGRVEFQSGKGLIIQKTEWAPGIWAGTEGLEIDNGATITEIEFESRCIMLNTSRNPYSPGQEIFIWDEEK